MPRLLLPVGRLFRPLGDLGGVVHVLVGWVKLSRRSEVGEGLIVLLPLRVGLVAPVVRLDALGGREERGALEDGGGEADGCRPLLTLELTLRCETAHGQGQRRAWKGM